MTGDHLRPLLDHVRDSHLLFLLGDQLAKAQTPASVNDAIRLGRLTALQKPSGGVAVESVTAPFQHAMTTKAGTECIGHVLPSSDRVEPAMHHHDRGWDRCF